MPNADNLDLHQINELIQAKCVFVKAPFGTPQEVSQILAQLKESRVRESPEFLAYLEEIYQNATTPQAQVSACLQTLVAFIKNTPQKESFSHTLETLKIKIGQLEKGIQKNAVHLVPMQDQIEEICYVLIHDETINFEDRLQTLYNLYDPIANCPPGIQGQINSTYLYLTTNNILQRLGSFMKAALYELNRGTSRQEFDAGPHALNKDLIYVHRKGVAFLDVAPLVKLGDRHGDGHSVADINAILDRQFTVPKFIENCENEILSDLARNIQLTLSLRDLGLNSNPDAAGQFKFKILQSAVKFLGIDLTNSHDVEALFSSDLIAPNGTYTLLSRLDELAVEFEDIIFEKPTDGPGVCWVDKNHPQGIAIWYKNEDMPAPELLLIVPSYHDLFAPIKDLQNKKATTLDLYSLINPKNKQGSTNLRLNFDFIRYKIFDTLLANRMLGYTLANNYSIRMNLLRPPYL